MSLCQHFMKDPTNAPLAHRLYAIEKIEFRKGAELAHIARL